MSRVAVYLGAILAAGCSGVVVEDGEGGKDVTGLSVPAQVKVGGHTVDVEKTYLPRVVQCENPDAAYESLKAQAVAARTYLTYRADGRAIPAISDGQSDQVYTCAANHYGSYISADVLQAVQATQGEVILWNGHVTAGFFVAGASRAQNTCRHLSDPTDTESYVTYNFGLIDDGLKTSSIGNRGNVANRGCMAQRLANCLADASGYDYGSLVRYFYGSDTQVAAIGTTPPSSAAITDIATADHLEVLCWSDTLGRPVARAACVQSVSNLQWYQCDDDGAFKSATIHGGKGSGPLGACAITISL